MGFKTHIEGGSWTGGGTEVFNCTLAERNAIIGAFNFMFDSGFRCLREIGLTVLMSELTRRTETAVEIDCRGPGCIGSIRGTATRGGNEINLCSPALPPVGLQVDTDAAVFHQLVISCGGFELDAWSLENHCYRFHGTVTPSVSTAAGFFAETSDLGGGLRAGRFVVWEPATGRVFTGREFAGSWASLPTIGRGRELFIDTRNYIFPR